MGRKRSIIVAASLAVVAAGALVIRFLMPADPEYAGRPLSFWLQGYDWSPSPTAISAGTKGTLVLPTQRGRDAADTAVKALGTNAIPRLLSMLQERDSPVITNLLQWIGSHSHGAFRYTPRRERASEVFWALGALGGQGEMPVSDLIRIYDNCPWYSRRVIVEMLGYRVNAPKATNIVPLLVRVLTNNDEIIRCDAMVSLGWLHSEPDIVVPALLKGLDDNSLTIQGTAATALGWYGKDASRALPVLRRLRSATNSNLNVNVMVKDARPMIDLYGPYGSRDLSLGEYFQWALGKIDPANEKINGPGPGNPLTR